MAAATICCSAAAPPHLLLSCQPISLLRPFNLLLPSTQSPHLCTPLRVTAGAADVPDPSLLRRPLVSTTPSPAAEETSSVVVSEEGEEDRGLVRRKGRRRKGEDLVDWEDKILGDTVPLVGFVRMILHSGKYENGDRLSLEHEKTITERLLPYHPEFEKKIGCGIDYITVGNHTEFEDSRCMFIMRKDGELIDFSYWKCIRGLIRKNYPLYADSFILRHFRRRRNAE